MEFHNVTANAKGNIYFNGKVVSHGITLQDGSTKTFGVAQSGKYHFDTAAAERMEIIDGTCEVKIDGSVEIRTYDAGSHFDIDANSGFDITVTSESAQYICSYL